MALQRVRSPVRLLTDDVVLSASDITSQTGWTVGAVGHGDVPGPAAVPAEVPSSSSDGWSQFSPFVPVATGGRPRPACRSRRGHHSAVSTHQSQKDRVVVFGRSPHPTWPAPRVRDTDTAAHAWRPTRAG
jgi:hypothetical protein